MTEIQEQPVETSTQPARPPVVMTVSIDQISGLIGYATNAQSEDAYQLLKAALTQIEPMLDRAIVAAVEQRIRAEMSRNGEVESGR